MPIEDDEYDPYANNNDGSESLPDDVAHITSHLRDTLTDDMAVRFIRGRFGHEPPEDPDEFDMVVEELIAEAFDSGCDDWDSFPH